MKKILNLLIIIGIIAVGTNLTDVKAKAIEETKVLETTTIITETTTVPETTMPQETIITETTTVPEMTMPQQTTISETTTVSETTIQSTPKHNIDTTGNNVKKGGYVKKKAPAYNLELEKVTEVKKGVRYYVYKEYSSGYSLIKVGNQIGRAHV